MFRSEARRGTSACATWMHGNMGCMTHLAQPITVCENWWCLLTPCCPPLPWVEHPPQSCLNFLQPVGLCPAQMSEVRSAARQTCARNWIVPWTCIADIWGKQECTADVWTAKCRHATGHSALRVCACHRVSQMCACHSAQQTCKADANLPYVASEVRQAEQPDCN